MNKIETGIKLGVCFYILMLVVGCVSNKVPVKYIIRTKEDLIKKDSTYTKRVEKYFPNVFPDSLKKEKIKYVIFHGESFRGHYIVVNKRDTIKEFYENKKEHCIFSKYYKIPSNTKKIEIEDVGGRGILKLKIPRKYDYIEITGPEDLWQVIYLNYPKVRTCV